MPTAWGAVSHAQTASTKAQLVGPIAPLARVASSKAPEVTATDTAILAQGAGTRHQGPRRAHIVPRQSTQPAQALALAPRVQVARPPQAPARLRLRRARQVRAQVSVLTMRTTTSAMIHATTLSATTTPATA